MKAFNGLNNELWDRIQQLPNTEIDRVMEHIDQMDKMVDQYLLTVELKQMEKSQTLIRYLYNADKIAAVVLNATGVSILDIRSNKSTDDIVLARAMMAVLLKRANMNSWEIGHYMNSDRSLSTRRIQKHETYLQECPWYQDWWKQALTELTQIELA